MNKTFPLDEVLSVSTGYLVAKRHVDALYDLMGHLTGDSGISTLGLAAAAKTCAAELKRQFPALENVQNPDFPKNVNMDQISAWVREQEQVVGQTEFSVEGGGAQERDYSFMERAGRGRN